MTNNQQTNNQPKLKVLGDKVMVKFDVLMSHLNIKLERQHKMYVGCCPVHGGDRNNALNLYHTGDTFIGNWACRTRQCEQHFQSSVIGFIRGVLSHQKYGWDCSNDTMVSFNDTVKFLSKFIEEDYATLTVDGGKVEKERFASFVNTVIPRPKIVLGVQITRAHIRTSIQIPADYYISRGYKKETLDRFDVGLCTTSNKPMYNRVVVPIYDDRHVNMVGCTGRSIFDKCWKCGNFHNGSQPCPNKQNAWQFSKWKHSAGFRGEDYVYNYWNAKNEIRDSKVAVIVESPGNVWRLHESNILNSIGIFGTSISNGQRSVINQSGALSLVLLMDNDRAGKQAAANIKREYEKLYRIYTPEFSKEDVGSMTVKEIHREILPTINRAKKELEY